jgi:hypothetical protein
VRHVVAAQVELVAQALLPQQPGGVLGALQCAGAVLPLALAAHDQQAQPPAQSVQVVAVVGRVVEVDGVPSSPQPTEETS